MKANHFKDVLTLQAGLDELISNLLFETVEPSTNCTIAQDKNTDLLFEMCMVSLSVAPRFKSSDIEQTAEVAFYYSKYKKNPKYKL